MGRNYKITADKTAMCALTYQSSKPHEQLHECEGLKRAARGLDISSGTEGQEDVAMKSFHACLGKGSPTEQSIYDTSRECIASVKSSLQKMDSQLTAFAIYLQTTKSAKSRTPESLLSNATALGYTSQEVNLLREKFSPASANTKRTAMIRI